MKQVGEKRRLAGVTQAILNKLIEDVRLLHYSFVFVVVVLVFAAVYYFLTPGAHGIAIQGAVGDGLTFWDATYFSVVTISSLGYGDMHPVGAARFLVGIQVLLGLTLMGIMLAKLTSFRLAYHVRRLYSSELQKRLEKFSSDFEKFEQRFGVVMSDLSETFRETPGKQPEEPDSNCTNQFREVLTQFNSRCSDLYDFITEESGKGAFFSNAPRLTLGRAIENLDQDLFLLSQLIISLPPRGRTVVLDPDNRGRTYKITACLSSLCDHVEQNSKDDQINALFASVREKCGAMPECLYTVPEIVTKREQPDQRLADGDSPQDSITPNPGDAK